MDREAIKTELKSLYDKVMDDVKINPDRRYSLALGILDQLERMGVDD